MAQAKRSGAASALRSVPNNSPEEKERICPAPDQAAQQDEELAAEQQWMASFEASWDVLEQLGAKALENDRQGKTLPMETILS